MAHPYVKETFDRLWELHQAKEADYAGQAPLSNFRQCERFGVPAWRGALVRMSDKWSRSKRRNRRAYDTDICLSQFDAEDDVHTRDNSGCCNDRWGCIRWAVYAGCDCSDMCLSR